MFTNIFEELLASVWDDTCLGGKISQRFKGSQLAKWLVTALNDLCQVLDNRFTEQKRNAFGFGEEEFAKLSGTLDDVCNDF